MTATQEAKTNKPTTTYRRISEISKNWYETPEGFLIVPAVIAKKTVLDYPEYGRKELMGDAIFEKSFIDSANGCPISFDHPENNGAPENVNNENYDKYIVGVVLTPEIDKEKEEVRANLKIFDKDVIELIKNDDIRELSQGYTCNLKFEKGIFNGVPYDAEQTEIILNHIALVRNGRGGKNFTILNSNRKLNTNNGGKAMEEKPEIVAGKPNPQNTTNQDEAPTSEELTLEQVAEKVASLENKVEMLAAAVDKIIKHLQISEEQTEVENAENPKPDGIVKEDEETKNRANKIDFYKNLIVEEIAKRERALALAKTIIGEQAEGLLRQNSTTAAFIRAVLAETGLPKAKIAKMSETEAQAWLEAKAELAYLSRQNSSYNYNHNGYNEYGDKIVFAEEF